MVSDELLCRSPFRFRHRREILDGAVFIDQVVDFLTHITSSRILRIGILLYVSKISLDFVPVRAAFKHLYGNLDLLSG